MAQNGPYDLPHMEDGRHPPVPDLRQPQLNLQICGCRCGQMSGQFGKDGEGGEGRGDADGKTRTT